MTSDEDDVVARREGPGMDLELRAGRPRSALQQPLANPVPTIQSMKVATEVKMSD